MCLNYQFSLNIPCIHIILNSPSIHGTSDNEAADKVVPENDISINELIEMGKRYLLIPLGLLFVEIIYSILTASQDTLAWIQEIVAKYGMI